MCIRIKHLILYLFANGFICRIVPYSKVRVRKCLLAADPLCRIECQHLREQVQRKWVCVWVESVALEVCWPENESGYKPSPYTMCGPTFRITASHPATSLFGTTKSASSTSLPGNPTSASRSPLTCERSTSICRT